jgi:hypothetical protein
MDFREVRLKKSADAGTFVREVDSGISFRGAKSPRSSFRCELHRGRRCGTIALSIATSPGADMITVQHEGPLTIVGVFGTFEIEDFMRIESEIGQQLHSLGRIDLMMDLSGMMNTTLDVALEDIKFTREHARDVGRVAILSERDSVIWAALLSRLFVQAEVRVFDSEAGAREWLKNDTK